ncbi:MAG: class D sortase [Candidatus Acidiferrales bacterium]|jgi:sortase A
MKVRIAKQLRPSTRVDRFLRWSRNAFLVVGVLALGYCCAVLLDTKIYQAYQATRFGQQLNNAWPAIAVASEPVNRPFIATPGAPLGKIEIPRIGLTAMIMEGTDGRTLRRAVGHIRGTPLPGEQGNVAIAGHRDTFFRPLRNILQDDEITLTTLNGSYRYLVDSTQVVPPEDTQVLDNSDDTTLTLVTCYPFYFVGPAPKRFIVRAHKIPG